MVGLNDLPKVDTFLGTLDLKTGSMIISAVCVVHPMVYGCTFFMPMSYLLLTMWILLAVFFAASVVLFVGLIKNNIVLIEVWIWYTLIFIVIMMMLMILLVLVFAAMNQKAKVLAVILGILWYMLTVYFVLVVNSHRKALIDGTGKTQSEHTSQSQNFRQTPDPPQAPGPPKTEVPPNDTASPDDAATLEPDTPSGFRRGKDQLKALRKASAKSYSKQ